MKGVRRRLALLSLPLALLAVLCEFLLLPACVPQNGNGELLSLFLSRAFYVLPVACLIAAGGFRLFAPMPRPDCAGHRLSYGVLLYGALLSFNNLPIRTLLRGEARVTAPVGSVFLWLLAALAIGTFEELLFRGFLLPLLLSRSHTPRGVWGAVLGSSALFGAVHLFNLAGGAAVGATLLQCGYSSLLGALYAVIFLRTGNILPPILLHAVFDFCGYLVPQLGEGTLADAPTVVVTVLLSLAAGISALAALFRLPQETVDRLFLEKTA